MKTTHRCPDSYGVVTTLVIVLSVWLVQTFGLLQNSDDRLSDFVNAFSAHSYNRSNVLLVYAPEAILTSDDQQLADLVQTINDFQPATVGIAHSLNQSQLRRLGSLPCASNIVVGHKRKDASASTSLVPPAIQHGFLDLYLDGQPVYRKHVGNFGTSSTPDWSFEAVIANQVARSSNTIPDGVLRIRFESGVDGLPHVQSTDFASGRVIPEMVRDCVVLIGRSRSDEVGFVTPTTSGSERMSTLELRGNVLQSLRNGDHVDQLSELSVLGLICLVAFVVVQWLRNVLNRWMRRICLFVSIGICVAAWFGLSNWSVQLPLSAMLLATWLAFIGVLHSRYRALKDLIENWKTLRHGSDQFTAEQPEDAWSILAASMNQIFFPRRMVLMELPSGSTHLQIVVRHDCDDTDIIEQRRDVNRVPYRAAVDRAYPQRTEKRKFFHASEDHGCVEFFVPLIMVSELIGFMVVEMDEVAIDQWGDFEETLSQYASEMAIFLATARASKDEIAQTAKVAHRVRVLPEHLMTTSLYKEEVEYQRAEQMLNKALDCAETSLAVCDIFGRLVKANSKMVAHLQREDISAQEMSCVDIMVALTDHDLGECRRIFRRCIVEHRVEQIVLPSKSADEASNIMFVKPLWQNEFDAGGGIESRFVAIEIVSGDMFHQITQWQQAFLQAHNTKSQEQLELLQKISGDLEVAKRERDSSVDPYIQIANEILQTVNQAKDATEVNLTASSGDCLMLCSKTILDASLRQSSPNREARGVKLSQTYPKQISNVLGNPFCLERMFSDVIDCLLQECDDQTKLVVTANETEDRVTYRFSTRADTAMVEGLDLELLRNSNGKPSSESTNAALTGSSLRAAQDTLLSKSQLDRLSESQRWLKSWGGDIDIQCDECFRVAISVSLSTVPQDPMSIAVSKLKEPQVSSEAEG